MSESNLRWINHLQSSTKVDVLRIVYGYQAIDFAIKFILDIGEQASREFVAEWTEEQINNSVFVIFTYQHRVNKEFRIMFKIGDDSNGSCIGHSIKYNKKNQQEIDDIINKCSYDLNNNTV